MSAPHIISSSSASLCQKVVKVGGNLCVGKFIAGNNICVLRGSALTQIRLDGK